jgi:hypothetical protein
MADRLVSAAIPFRGNVLAAIHVRVGETGTLVVSRWKRYGQDRLYAVTSAGVRIGWWDLRTEEAHPESPEHHALLADAVADWKRRTWPTPRPVVRAAERPRNTTRPAGRRPELVPPSQRASMLVEELDEVVLGDARWQYLDHVVIGPAGVLVLDAERHHGSRIWVGSSVWVDGHRTGSARLARREAERVGALLGRACGFDLPVVGVVVPVDARAFTMTSQPRDIFVIQRERLTSWLLGLGEVIPVEALHRVHDLARRPSTWS